MNNLEFQTDLQNQVDELRAVVNSMASVPSPPPAPSASMPFPCCTYCGIDVYAKFKVDCYWFHEERFCETLMHICRKDCFVNGGCDGCGSYISIADADKIIENKGE